MQHMQSIKFSESPTMCNLMGFFIRKCDEKRANFLTGKLYYARKLHPYPAPQESHVHTIYPVSLYTYMFTHDPKSCKPFFNGN